MSGPGAGRRVRVTIAASVCAGFALAVATGIEVGSVPSAFVLAAPFYLVAVIVLSRVGSHPVAWLLLSIGATLQITTFDSIPWLSPLWMGWVTTWGFPALFAQFAWLIILFPDGGPSPGWRRAGTFASATVLTGFFVSDISDNNNVYLGRNPTGLARVPPEVAMVGFMAIFVVLVAAAVSLFLRARRVPLPERITYRPVEASLIMLALVIALVVVPTALSPRLYQLMGGDNMWAPVIVVYLLIPVAFGVAITRYRLYDIDKIISRTVIYTLVVALVALVYSVPVVLVSSVVGGSRALVTAAAILAAAAVFNPVRSQIRQRVDRRFDRARYDAGREIAAFAAQLGPRHSVESLPEELAGRLQRTLHPETSRLWIRAIPPARASRNDSGTQHV